MLELIGISNNINLRNTRSTKFKGSYTLNFAFKSIKNANLTVNLNGMNWFTRMGRRVLIHEWWNFWFCDRRVANGPTLEQYWGDPQDHQEVPLRVQ